jgi:hypothetical protein
MPDTRHGVANSSTAPPESGNRDERKFDGPAALLEQIQRDIRRARVILAAYGAAGHA